SWLPYNATSSVGRSRFCCTRPCLPGRVSGLPGSSRWRRRSPSPCAVRHRVVPVLRRTLRGRVVRRDGAGEGRPPTVRCSELARETREARRTEARENRCASRKPYPTPGRSYKTTEFHSISAPSAHTSRCQQL